MADDTRTLDCGHPPSPHGPHTTGTAHTHDGREICWTCADNEQREALRNLPHGQAVAGYLSADRRHITTWSGGHLLNVTEVGSTRSTTPTGGRFTLVTWRGKSDDGTVFYGRGGGEGMVTSIRKAHTKEHA